MARRQQRSESPGSINGDYLPRNSTRAVVYPTSLPSPDRDPLTARVCPKSCRDYHGDENQATGSVSATPRRVLGPLVPRTGADPRVDPSMRCRETAPRCSVVTGCCG